MSRELWNFRMLLLRRKRRMRMRMIRQRIVRFHGVPEFAGPLLVPDDSGLPRKLAPAPVALEFLESQVIKVGMIYHTLPVRVGFVAPLVLAFEGLLVEVDFPDVFEQVAVDERRIYVN